jgi:tetratricopeptide (TPR) repeat protein
MLRQTLLTIGIAAAAVGAIPAAAADVDLTGAEYADYLVARYAERQHDPAAAADRFERALSRKPDDVELLRAAADAALAVRNVTRSAAIGRRALKRGKVPPLSAQLSAAALELKVGRTEKAREALMPKGGNGLEDMAVVMLRAWSEPDPRRALPILESRGFSPTPVWSALRHYQIALQLDVAGKGAEAVAAYAKAREASGTLTIAHFTAQHGELLERLERRDEAIALYEDALKTLASPLLTQALARARAGGPPPPSPTASRAAATCLYALALLSTYPPEQLHWQFLALAMALDAEIDGPRMAYAEAMRAIDQRASARGVLNEIVPQSPYYQAARQQIAWSFMVEKRDPEAVAELETLVARTGSPSARRALADLYRALERPENAAPIYAALADEAPADTKDWRLFYNYGAALDLLGRWEEAERVFHRALAIEPRQPETLNYLGYTWVDRGERIEEGLALLEQAVSQRPNEGYIIDSLGWAYYRLGRYDQAIVLLERAVGLSPADPTLIDHLGDVYWTVGRRLEARYQWKRVLTLSPTPALAAAAQRKIAEGLPSPEAPVEAAEIQDAAAADQASAPQ